MFRCSWSLKRTFLSSRNLYYNSTQRLFPFDSHSSNEGKATFELDENGAGNIDRIVTEDVDGNLGFFNLELTDDDELLLSLDFPALGYRGFFAFANFSTNTDSEVFANDTLITSSTPTNSLSIAQPIRGRSPNRKSRALSHVSSGQRTLQSNPGFVDIFLVECLRNVDPSFLEVTASSEGSDVPVASERRSEGHYRVSLSVQEADNISEEILDAVCSGISAVGQACPFIIGELCEARKRYLNQLLRLAQLRGFLVALVCARRFQRVSH